MSKRRFIFLKGRFVRIDRRFIFQIGILVFIFLLVTQRNRITKWRKGVLSKIISVLCCLFGEVKLSPCRLGFGSRFLPIDIWRFREQKICRCGSRYWLCVPERADSGEECGRVCRL